MEDYFSKYSQEFIKELELLYPGPYTVYFYKEFPITKRYNRGFKLGCTRDLKSRIRILELHTGKKLSLPKTILETNSLLEAAMKERERALELGIPGKTDYINDLHRHTFCNTEEATRKRVASTDWESRNSKLSAYAKSGRYNNNKKTSKPVIQLTKEDTYISTYPSAMEAQRQLKITGIAEAIRGVSQKTAGGFKWIHA